MVAGFGLSVLFLAAAVAGELAFQSRLAWARFGVFGFLFSSTWDPVKEIFGALPFAYGTLLSSALALLIAAPLGLGSAIFLAELAPRRLSDLCSFLLELLAAIPSVIIGLMGIFVLVPAVRVLESWLGQKSPSGLDVLSAGLILAVMILPYIASVSREVLLSVPRTLKEGLLALGATRWEMVRRVSLPYAGPGILGALFLALGRALGETMAVTMVIGNTPRISASLFKPAYTMAGVIANEFTEATSDLYIHSLLAIGLALFGITILANALARLMIHRLNTRLG